MTIPLIVTGVRAEACDVLSFELRDPNGKPLPAFSPGAHLEIDVPTAHGQSLIRHYSISSDWRDADRYVVTVGRAAESRGGSVAMHHDVRVGTTLSVRGPRNHFPLKPDAEFYRFIGGGIGITPIMSMLRWCIANNKPWSLLYCARSKNRAALLRRTVAND
jgi:tetrachlorobenzoquinone reductase